jgi:hypothetical protein
MKRVVKDLAVFSAIIALSGGPLGPSRGGVLPSVVSERVGEPLCTTGFMKIFARYRSDAGGGSADSLSSNLFQTWSFFRHTDPVFASVPPVPCLSQP